ncbi:hypothetical protein KFK09_018579 [Dendrobium nobile]|uniref:Uncharacterized protein n=1 Tax=Dendrobium nobile TaxID=94219 RepID=A0A8T3AW65_DENNO|nr:hypothetical protein KFK09_018579 [Dendrobium nobile]
MINPIKKFKSKRIHHNLEKNISPNEKLYREINSYKNVSPPTEHQKNKNSLP